MKRCPSQVHTAPAPHTTPTHAPSAAGSGRVDGRFRLRGVYSSSSQHWLHKGQQKKNKTESIFPQLTCAVLMQPSLEQHHVVLEYLELSRDDTSEADSMDPESRARPRTN